MKHFFVAVMVVFGLLFMSGPVQADVSNGLIAYYPFNGNANDESGNANNGTVNGAILSTDRFGNPNNAMSFNGINNFIDLNPTNTTVYGNNERSIFAWIKTSNGEPNCIVSTGTSGYKQAFNLVINYNSSGGIIGVMGYNNDFYPKTGKKVNDGNWHFVGVTFNKNGTLTTYVDGNSDNITTKNYSTTGNNNYIGMSNHLGGNENYFKGDIDSVRIYSRALSDSEIQELYNKKTSPTCTFNIVPATGTFPAGGDSQVVSITVSDSSCNWTTSSSLSWVNLSPTTGTGSGTVTVKVDKHTGTNTRTGKVTIAGKTYTITQSAGNGTMETISIISPVDKKPVSFGNAGSVEFMFTKVSGAAKYTLHLKLTEMLNLNATPIPIPLDLTPSSGSTAATPGFSETTLGMVYDLKLDAATWNILALYDTFWGIEAYDSAGNLIGATKDSNGSADKYLNQFKFLSSNAIVMTDPKPGGVLQKSGSAPTFKWDLYPGSASYTVILAHVGSLGFDKVIQKDNLTLNLLTMDTSTWQGMPEGTWYWSVFGYDNTGAVNPTDFTLFDFTVSSSGGTVTSSPSTPVVSSICGAYVAPGVWKEFDCYNLAAIGKTTGADPFTPSWELVGGYYTWGRKGPDSSQWHNTNTKHFAHGPIGPGSSEANDGPINDFGGSKLLFPFGGGFGSSTMTAPDVAPNGAWSDTSKTANDPCPAGYRVPTQAQWQGVVDNNTQSTVGTWSNSTTNYSSARFFSSSLMLPAAGFRNYDYSFFTDSGELKHRGGYGYYWSSSEGTGGGSWDLDFGSNTVVMKDISRGFGLSVRCVAE
jgi:uncharacterized protein (TIGR02145 family)